MSSYNIHVKRLLSTYLVAMLEAKHDLSFVDIVRRNMRDITRQFGQPVAEACYLVCALHTFGIEFPSNMLASILKVNSLEADVLAKTRGFLIAPQVGDYGLRTRHSVIATVIFDHDLGRYDRLRTFVSVSLLQNQRLIPRLFHAIRLQFTSRDLSIDAVRSLYKSALYQPSIRKYIFTTWGILERDLCNYDEARRLFSEASKADPKHAPAWQAWAIMENRLR